MITSFVCATFFRQRHWNFIPGTQTLVLYFLKRQHAYPLFPISSQNIFYFHWVHNNNQQIRKCKKRQQMRRIRMGRKSILWMLSIPPFFCLIIASMRKDRRTQIEMRLKQRFSFIQFSREEKQKQSRGIYVCFISIVSLSPSSPSISSPLFSRPFRHPLFCSSINIFFCMLSWMASNNKRHFATRWSIIKWMDISSSYPFYVFTLSLSFWARKSASGIVLKMKD